MVLRLFLLDFVNHAERIIDFRQRAFEDGASRACSGSERLLGRLAKNETPFLDAVEIAHSRSSPPRSSVTFLMSSSSSGFSTALASACAPAPSQTSASSETTRRTSPLSNDENARRK